MERNPNFGNLKIREVSPISNQAGEEKKKCVFCPEPVVSKYKATIYFRNAWMLYVLL